MKTLVKILAVLLIVGLLLGVGLFLTRNSLIAGVLAKAGSTALGTKTSVDSVETDFGSGAFAIRGLVIENPDGYGAENIFSFGAAETDLPLGNLRKDPLVIERVGLSGLSVSLERKDGKFNYEPILENLKRFGGGSDGETSPEEKPAEEVAKGEGKTIRIERIDISDWTLQLDLSEQIQLDPLKLEGWTIENIEVGGDQATGELVGRIFNEVLERVLSEGLPGIPADVLAQIGPELDALKGSLTGGLAELGGDLQGKLDDAMQDGKAQLDDALQQGKDALGEGLEGLGGQLGGLEGLGGLEVPEGAEALDGVQGLEEAGGDLLNNAENTLKQGLGGLLGGGKKED